jgi:type II secretion system protein G
MKNAGRYYRLLVGAQVLMFVFAIPVLFFAPEPQPTETRYQRTVNDLKGGLQMALEMFRVDCGRYPTTSEGLDILVIAPTNGSLANYRGPYLEGGPPCDSWGRPYVYRFPAVHSTNAFDLYSLGPDGLSKSGGNDPDDIGNWDKTWSPGFTSEALWEMAAVFLLIIPFLFVIRLIAGFFSPRLREVVERNRFADRVWWLLGIINFLIILLGQIFRFAR